MCTVIEWLIQRAADDPLLATGVPPAGLLSGPEMAVYNDLYSIKRREDWLLGRWTAKRLVQAAVENSGKRRPSCREISILAAKDGAPEVWFGEGDRLSPGNLSVSISHSNGASFCAFLRSGAIPLGADIEAVEPRSKGFVEDYFTEEEKESVRLASPEHRDYLITAIWSGKEAALKAVRQGLRLDTRSVTCTFPSPFQPFADGQEPYHWRPFLVKWRTKSAYPSLGGWWRVWQEYILTLVTTAESNHAPEC